MSADLIQGSDAWFAARCGNITASRIADIIAKTKTGESASRANYRAQLVAERLTGKPAESFSNAAMQWGADTEPFARIAYEARTGIMVKEVGFIAHPSISRAGASPDGLADDGLVEIKCPNTATHIEYFLSGVAPEKYKPQMAWQCACTGRQWVDFVSFDPRLPESMQLMVSRYVPDSEYIGMLQSEVIRFIGEVDSLIEQLLKKAA